MKDISSIGRSTSIIIGYRIFADNTLFGSGLNSYQYIQDKYSYDLEYFKSEPIVHNLFVSYAQQMGLFGLVFSFTPIVYLLSLKYIEIKRRFLLGSLFSVIGVFGTDIFYMSLSWTILAMVSAANVKNVMKNIVKRNSNYNILTE
jgi:hypothetical protein